jgi:chromate reductase, NAD(P)H dehydrogenase (quinone)
LKVLGLSGSLRAASFNRALLRTAAEVAPDTMTVEIFPLDAVPLFNEDVERQGDPEAVAALKAAIASADAILIACPEYNFGITGVLKNAIDWASRPPGRSVMAGKPTALIGASTGAGATRLSQAMTRQILSALGIPILPVPFFLLGQAGEKFDQGRLVDERSRELLGRVLRALEAWANRLKTS